MDEHRRIGEFLQALSTMESLVPAFLLLLMAPLKISLGFLFLFELPFSLIWLGLRNRFASESLHTDRQRKQAALVLLLRPVCSLAAALVCSLFLGGWLMVIFCLWSVILLFLSHLALIAIRDYHRRLKTC